MGQTAINLDITNLSDGFSMGGGISAKRTLTVTGSNVTLAGYSGQAYLFPTQPCTLSGNSLTNTFTSTQTFISDLFVTGSIYRIVAFITSSRYSASVTDTTLFISTSLSNVTITLPTASSVFPGKEYFIKDRFGSASLAYIYLNTTGSDLIDGTTQCTISASYGKVSVYTDGINWFTF